MEIRIYSYWHSSTLMYHSCCGITHNSWHSFTIFRDHHHASSHIGPNLTLNNHVSSLSCSVRFYTREFCHIRPALMEPMVATLSASLVQSRLDYANSIMYGTSASNTHKLVCPQFPYACSPAFSPPSFI